MGDRSDTETDGLLGPADGADDDLDDDQPPPGPSPREVRRRWAEEGNVEAFLDLIHGKPWCLFSIHEQLRNLLRACEARAVKDPAAFAGEVFARMAGFNAFLVLRAQLFVEERAVGRGELRATPTIAGLSNDVAERLLPRLMELQKATAEILAAQAQAARLWGLARAKESRANGSTAGDRGGSRRSRASVGKAARAGSKAASPEAEGARDGVVPLPARSRRRG